MSYIGVFGENRFFAWVAAVLVVLSIGVVWAVSGVARPVCEVDLHGLAWQDVTSIYDRCIPLSVRIHVWRMVHEWPKVLVSPLLDPYLYVALLGILTLERLIPVQADQRSFSAGFFHDAGYFVAQQFFQVMVITACWSWFHVFYQEHLTVLTVQGIQQWPMVLKVAMGLLVADFMDWLHHYLRHKVGLFWCFHTVHHSQRHMNMFTDDRNHAFDVLIANLILFLPLSMFQAGQELPLYLALLWKWYPKLYHANVRSNFGILRYILVTPQSHRVHHSLEVRHRDKNFGVVFSIWDRLFGTLHPDYDEYPATGIAYEDVPLMQSVSAVNLLKGYVDETISPFIMAWQKLKQLLTPRRVFS